MQHFFVDASQVSEETIWIEGSDVNHMKNVLRMRIGEEVTVSDGQGKEYLCQVRDFEEEQVQLKIVETKASDAELPSKIYLFQGLPKQEKMELIVQKCVELGIYAVVPVSMKRCGEAGCEKRGEESGALEYNCSQRSQTVRAGDRAGSDVCEDL